MSTNCNLRAFACHVPSFDRKDSPAQRKVLSGDPITVKLWQTTNDTGNLARCCRNTSNDRTLTGTLRVAVSKAPTMSLFASTPLSRLISSFAEARASLASPASSSACSELA